MFWKLRFAEEETSQKERCHRKQTWICGPQDFMAYQEFTRSVSRSFIGSYLGSISKELFPYVMFNEESGRFLVLEKHRYVLVPISHRIYFIRNGDVELGPWKTVQEAGENMATRDP